MRISTSQIFNQSLASMLAQQTNVAQTQQQVSTGKRILNPSDDPAGSVQLLNLQREFSLSEQYVSNGINARNKLEREEGALASATDLLQRIRELAVQALNDTNTPADRKAISTEINQLNQQLLSLANTRDANGDYLFSGFATDIQPYDNIYGSYQGDEGQRNMKVGAGVFIATNDPASKLFEAAFTQTLITPDGGNTGSGQITVTNNSGVAATFPELTFSYADPPGEYTVTDGVNSASFSYQPGMTVNLGELDPAFPGLGIRLEGTPDDGDQLTISKEPADEAQTMFITIQNFANALVENRVGAGDSPNNGDFLINMDAALDRVVDGRAQVGGRLNAIDQQTEINESLAFAMEKSISEIQDLDYAEAISRLTRQLTGLQAAQQTFSRVQSLSLFNFL